jgi:Flp pilus assembly protein TadG
MSPRDVKKTENKQVRTPPRWFRGAALVEFSIISPLLFVLMFGFAEMGRLLYQQNQLTKQVTTGARYIARIPNAVNPANCNTGAGWANATATASNLISQSVSGETVLPGLDAAGAITFSVASSAVGTNACVIRVEAAVDYRTMFGASPVPFLNIGPVVLNTSAEERFIGL